jgi:glyoxylase-like metal-dependent hydrolase (beta-lactamase superfamily II)
MTTRTLTAVLGNSQRLDGGAMFGNAPRALWSRWIAPDEANRIPLACRAMLINDRSEGRERNILCETGIGAFFPPELRDRYGVVEANHILLEGLRGLGLTHTDIDVVVLSHLHFDHAGGLLSAWEPGKEPDLLFPEARFIVGSEAFARAKEPHPRDRASFIPGLVEKLEASGRLVVVDSSRAGGSGSDVLGPGYRFHTSNGHTPGLLLLEVEMENGPVVFASDLIPGRPWVHLPITMGYDRYPELLIDEKRALLEDLVARHGRLFYTHDPVVAMSSVRMDPSGRFAPFDEIAAPVELAA